MKGSEHVGSEIRYSHLLQILCMIFFYSVWILDSLILKTSTFLAEFIPLPIRLACSISIIAIGSILISKAHRKLFEEKSSDLITDGIFAHVRHPMYLGIILVYLGWLILTLSLLTLIPWIAVIALYSKMADYEEKQLEQKLGSRYAEYKKRVPKWIPKLKPSQSALAAA